MLSVEQYSAIQVRSADRVLDTLQGLDVRTASQYGRERRFRRQSVKCTLEVHLLARCNGGRAESFRAWSVDVSQNGLGFIAPEEIDCKEVCVGVPGAAGRVSWFLAQMVRKRQVPEERFWVYGILFLARVDGPPVQPAQTA